MHLKLFNLRNSKHVNSVGFHNKNLQYPNQDSELVAFVYSLTMGIDV